MKHIKPDLIEGLCLTPSVELGGWSKRSKFNFFINGHVAYQIKGNHECSSMVANILLAEPTHPPDPLIGVKRSKFNSFRT